MPRKKKTPTEASTEIEKEVTSVVEETENQEKGDVTEEQSADKAVAQTEEKPAEKIVTQAEKKPDNKQPKTDAVVKKQQNNMTSKQVRTPPGTAPKTNTKKKKKKKPAIAAAVEPELIRDTRAILNGAKQTKQILTGTLERVQFESGQDDPGYSICAILSYEGFRIIIPAAEMAVEVPQDANKQEKISLYKKYLSAMIASEISYVVIAVDEQTNIAIGSRKIANGIIRKRYFEERGKNSGKTRIERMIEQGTPVEAHVTAVAGSVVRLDVCGAEAKVFAKDAAWRYTSNLSSLFCPGDSIKVVIKSIISMDPELYKVEASIKEAYPNTQIANVANLQVDSICVGQISGVTDKGYYIAIGSQETGVDAFCKIVHGKDVPQLGDKVVCQIIKVDTESGYVLAKITRIIHRAGV